MRALLLVLATGCASDAWRDDFDGEFRVTSYARDNDTCDPSTRILGPKPYFRFYEAAGSRSLQWCDHDLSCSPFGQFVLEPEEQGLFGSAGGMGVADGQVVECVLRYDEVHVWRTSEMNVRLEMRAYQLIRPYDDQCTAAHAIEAMFAGDCTVSERLDGTRERTR